MHNINNDQIRRSPPPTPLINPKNPPLKRVRIALPPSPPPDAQMSQQPIENSYQPRRSQRTNVSLLQSGRRVVLPTEKVEEGEEQHTLRSGSKWRQYELALLKVKFEPDEDSELLMLDVEHEWTLSQRQRILPSCGLLMPLVVDSLIQQLSSITPDMLKESGYEDDIAKYAPEFKLFFDQLKLLLSNNAESMDEITLPAVELSLQTEKPGFFPEQLPFITSPSASETKKRPNSLTLTSPTKVRLTSSQYRDVPHTPDQPTIPKNPGFSGDSIESTDEDNTKQMIRILINTALLGLRSDFSAILWPKYAQKCRLRSSGYFTFVSLLTSRQERLRFVLGRKAIIAINDGSITIDYSYSPNRISTWGINDHSPKIKSVISIEVFSPQISLIIGKTKA
jgi:hypothetical protein